MAASCESFLQVLDVFKIGQAGMQQRKVKMALVEPTVFCCRLGSWWWPTRAGTEPTRHTMPQEARVDQFDLQVATAIRAKYPDLPMVVRAKALGPGASLYIGIASLFSQPGL